LQSWFLPTLQSNKNIKIMAYTFQVTAKRTIGNKIPKGSTVQVIKNGSATPSPKEILAAYEQQLGIVVKGIEVHTSYFDIVKL